MTLHPYTDWRVFIFLGVAVGARVTPCFFVPVAIAALSDQRQSLKKGMRYIWYTQLIPYGSFSRSGRWMERSLRRPMPMLTEWQMGSEPSCIHVYSPTPYRAHFAGTVSLEKSVLACLGFQSCSAHPCKQSPASALQNRLRLH